MNNRVKTALSLKLLLMLGGCIQVEVNDNEHRWLSQSLPDMRCQAARDFLALPPASRPDFLLLHQPVLPATLTSEQTLVLYRYPDLSATVLKTIEMPDTQLLGPATQVCQAAGRWWFRLNTAGQVGWVSMPATSPSSTGQDVTTRYLPQFINRDWTSVEQLTQAVNSLTGLKVTAVTQLPGQVQIVARQCCDGRASQTLTFTFAPAGKNGWSLSVVRQARGE